MKISVVIPTYNRRNVVMNAVNSVLNQNPSGLDYEIVVSDDGSSDNTAELFKKKDKRIRYFFNKKNSGVNVARNLGIKETKGDYVLFLDSDDVLTPDCFANLEQKKNQLSFVNLFGTSEIKTGRKMFHIAEERIFTYKEWLEEKYIGGEFLSVVKKDVFKKDLFDEERFCFERFFWNRVIKKYGAFASPTIMRLYSFDEDNRITKALLNPENASKRYADYTEHLKRFGQDYLDFGLIRQYSDLLLRIGVYALLSNNMSEGRNWLLKSLHEHISFMALFLLCISIFGFSITRNAYLLFIRIKKH